VTAPDGVVVDASVALRWLLNSDPGEQADAVMSTLDHRFALVPVLWHHEVANGLRNAVRAGNVAAQDVSGLCDALGLLDIRTDIIKPQVGRLGVEALLNDLTAYSVAYLLLARDRGLPLATFDTELAAAARAAQVPLVFEGA